MAFLDITPVAALVPLPKRKPGRPRKPLAPQEPLKSKRYETMVHLCVNKGLDQTKAYKSTNRKPVKGKSATIGASRIFARPDVRARMEYLQNQRDTAPLHTETAPVDPSRPPDELVSLEDIGKQLSKVIRSGGMDSAFVSACTAALKIISTLNESRDLQLDPCHLAAHLATFAARPGKEIVKEAGGLAFLLERVAAICRVTTADIHAASAP